MWRRVSSYPQLKCVQGQKIKLGGEGAIVTVEVCKRVCFPLGSCFDCIPQPTLNNNLDGVCTRLHSKPSLCCSPDKAKTLDLTPSLCFL